MKQYLIAKKFLKRGCVAISSEYLRDILITLNALEYALHGHRIQLVILNSPAGYPEYRPYEFVEDEGEFMRAVIALKDVPNDLEVDLIY